MLAYFCTNASLSSSGSVSSVWDTALRLFTEISRANCLRTAINLVDEKSGWCARAQTSSSTLFTFEDGVVNYKFHASFFGLLYYAPSKHRHHLFSYFSPLPTLFHPKIRCLIQTVSVFRRYIIQQAIFPFKLSTNFIKWLQILVDQ